MTHPWKNDKYIICTGVRINILTFFLRGQSGKLPPTDPKNKRAISTLLGYSAISSLRLVIFCQQLYPEKNQQSNFRRRFTACLSGFASYLSWLFLTLLVYVLNFLRSSSTLLLLFLNLLSYIFIPKLLNCMMQN